VKSILTSSSIVFCALATFSLTAAAQTTRDGVTVTAEKNVDFSRFRTYQWRPGQPSADKTIDAQIIAAVDHELAKLGMSKAASPPSDVIVSYASLTRTDVDIKGKKDSKGLLPQHMVGTLVVAFYHPDTNRRLLRLRADLPIDTQPSELQAAINRAAGLMFAEYPTRRRR
jgi:hypothetical protein